MYVEKEYSISAREFFAVISNSLKADYYKNTGKVLDLDGEITGINYYKKFGKKNKNSVEVILREYEPNSKYKSEIISTRGTQIIIFNINELGSERILVTYTEEVTDLDFFKKLNYTLLFPLMKKKLKERMISQLDIIAKQAKANKKD